MSEQARINLSFSGGNLTFLGSWFLDGADIVIVVVAMLNIPRIWVQLLIVYVSEQDELDMVGVLDRPREKFTANSGYACPAAAKLPTLALPQLESI